MDTSKIPHPPGRLPVLGDVLGVSPRTPIQSVYAPSHALGPIYCRRVLGFDWVFVGGADLTAELNDERRFAKYNGMYIDGLREITGDGLFTAHNDDPNWAAAHDILQPAFTAQAMAGYHAVMRDVARELTARWDAAAAVGRPVEVSADTTRLALETIGRTGFGYSFGAFARPRPHPFAAALARSLRRAQYSVLPWPWMRRALAGSPSRQRADLRLMTGLVDDVIAARRDQPGDDGDLLGLMLGRAHPGTGRRLDPVNIRNQVITFLAAGSETTSGALAFALYYLSRHPDVRARAQAEADEMWGDEPDPRPEFADVAKLRYVRRVLDESLRLWPPAPTYMRTAREDTELGGKYPMRVGDWVAVGIPLLHRDPAVWGPDPEAFDPGRFTSAEIRKRPAQAYKPFGTGPRACIGRQFALHEAVLELGLLVHRYDLSPEPGYRLRVAESGTLKPDGFRLRLTRRRETGRKAQPSRAPGRRRLK